MLFDYTTKSAAGVMDAGSIDADSLSDARELLRSRGLFVLQIVPGRGAAKTSPSRWLRLNVVRVRRADVLMVTSQLAIMSRSGVDLADAIDGIARTCSSRTLRAALNQIHSDISDGKSVSAAFERQRSIFGSAYVAIIKAGEVSGRLPVVLERLREMIENEIQLAASIRSVLTYPVVLSSVAMLVVSAIVFFVLPQFSKVFAGSAVSPPALTVWMLSAGEFVREHTTATMLGAGVAMALLVYVGRTDRVRSIWHQFVLRNLLLRRASRSLLSGRLFRLTGSLLQAGIPLLESLQLSRSSMSNLVFRQLIDEMEENVTHGRGLSSTLEATRIVPQGITQMIITAEKTGDLGSVMEMVGEYYEREGEQKLRSLIKLLEPAIIVVMGVVVSGIVLAVILPLLDVTTMGGG